MKSKLDSCIKLETAIGEIYRELSTLFPEAKELFEQLAEDEAIHAEILTRAKELENNNELPHEFVRQISTMVNEPLLYVQMLKHKLAKRQLSLPEALELSLKIEQFGAEYYLQATMLKEATEKAISFLQQFYNANVYHTDKISKFIASYSSNNP